MIYPVKYSDRAIETFDAICEQIELRWGLKHLSIFEERTLKVIDTLENLLFFQAIEVNSKVRKAFIHKNCSMFYRVGSSYIEVLFFWDNRQAPIFL
jgi:hypothetical protein